MGPVRKIFIGQLFFAAMLLLTVLSCSNMFSQGDGDLADLAFTFEAGILFSGTTSDAAGTPYLVPTADRIEATLSRSGGTADSDIVVTQELTRAAGSDHVLSSVLEFPSVPTNVEHTVALRIFSHLSPDETLHAGSATIAPITRSERSASVSVRLNPGIMTGSVAVGFDGDPNDLPENTFALYRLDVVPGAAHEIIVNVNADPETLHADILTSSFLKSGIEVATDAAGALTAELPASTTPYYLALYTPPGIESIFYSLTLTSLTTTSPFAIGDDGPAGGYIFYENPDYQSDGWRFMEAAPQDAFFLDMNGDPVELITWSTLEPQPDVVGTSSDIGTGLENTDLITSVLADFNVDDTASQVAASYEEADFSDWFLPSEDELVEMYTNLHDIGIGGFDEAAVYWSSTQSDNISRARAITFSDGGTFNAEKSIDGRVRPARRF